MIEEKNSSILLRAHLHHRLHLLILGFLQQPKDLAVLCHIEGSRYSCVCEILVSLKDNWQIENIERISVVNLYI